MLIHRADYHRQCSVDRSLSDAGIYARPLRNLLDCAATKFLLYHIENAAHF
jgi:hypothetical protein